MDASDGSLEMELLLHEDVELLAGGHHLLALPLQLLLDRERGARLGPARAGAKVELAHEDVDADVLARVALVPERVEERLGELEQPLEEEREQARRRDRERAELRIEREGREEDERVDEHLHELHVRERHPPRRVVADVEVLGAEPRQLAQQDHVDIRYYSIIYNVIDDMKKLMEGLLATEIHERQIGYAEVREVFSVSKAGKAAGCMVTEGLFKRGNKVRLLRDNVVIFEGSLKSLRRFKDDVREVQQGYECGTVSYTHLTLPTKA